MFNNQKKSKKINILNYLDNINIDIVSMYKKIENNILYLNDFFNIFDNNIPTHILKTELQKSKNKIIKKIMNNANIKKKQINDVIGIIDSSQKFKIKNSVFDKGISCKSLKKRHFILFLQHILFLNETEIKSKTIKELCIITRDNLLQLEMQNSDILYFKITL